MTDEERQKLAELHTIGDCKISVDSTTHNLCKWAGEVIERLIKEKEDLHSACYNYLKQAEAGLDELKTNLREDAWWLNPTPTR